ncbi:hypothetical protein Droror1_Dr00008273 [Drosera rotundifolia]
MVVGDDGETEGGFDDGDGGFGFCLEGEVVRVLVAGFGGDVCLGLGSARLKKKTMVAMKMVVYRDGEFEMVMEMMMVIAWWGWWLGEVGEHVDGVLVLVVVANDGLAL